VGTAIRRGGNHGKPEVEGACVWFLHGQTHAAEHARENTGITGVLKNAAGSNFLNIGWRRHGAEPHRRIENVVRPLFKGRRFHSYEEREYVTRVLDQNLIRFRGCRGDVEVREEFLLQMFVSILVVSRRGLGKKACAKAAGSAYEEDTQP